MRRCSLPELAGVLLLAGCTHSDAPKEAPVEAAASAPPPSASSDLSFIFADASPLDDAPDAGDAGVFGEEDLDPYERAAPVSGKSIGHTSVVFRLGLAGGLVAAYKPESKRGHLRYRGEIAAYRLARALGLHNVPAAVPRSFPEPALRRALGKNARALSLFRTEEVPHGGVVRGALMPWIPHLEFLPVESPSYRARWKRWLSSGGKVDGADRGLAAQISTMIVFDTITGNWDRWSGANVGIDRATGTLLYVDNDGAFFDPVPQKPLAAQLALLAGVDRYSRALVTALRALDAVHLADAFGDETPGTPLLPARVVAGADARRQQVLHLIEGKVKVLGESAVLYFE